MSTASILGANIAARRVACGLDQSELAERVKVSSPMMSRIESGSRPPSVNLLVDIADVLDASTDKLLGREREGGS